MPLCHLLKMDTKENINIIYNNNMPTLATVQKGKACMFKFNSTREREDKLTKMANKAYVTLKKLKV